MSKTITIKLTKSSPKSGPFTISDELGNILVYDVLKSLLIKGLSFIVADDINIISISSKGTCNITKSFNVSTISPLEFSRAEFVETKTACLWRHLTNVNDVYNKYYGVIYPYIIEYSFSFPYHSEILQNVKDYTKVYKYLQDDSGVFSYNDKVETDDIWFNKAIVYNNQQCSGILNLVPKPKHNLHSYLQYPLFGIDSKTITFTKSDNFYQYNTFWNILKDKTQPLFLTSCESLSLDKIPNQTNLDYSTRSFKKETIRAKELKIRHILDDRSDVNVVSQFIFVPSMLSYK